MRFAPTWPGSPSDLGADIAVQRGGLHRRAMRLVVMDVDSTLLQDEAIDLLADAGGLRRRGVRADHGRHARRDRLRDRAPASGSSGWPAWTRPCSAN